MLRSIALLAFAASSVAQDNDQYSGSCVDDGKLDDVLACLAAENADCESVENCQLCNSTFLGDEEDEAELLCTYFGSDCTFVFAGGDDQVEDPPFSVKFFEDECPEGVNSASALAPAALLVAALALGASY